MQEIFSNFRVDNKWALAAAIAIVFAWLAAELLKRTSPGDTELLVARVMRMIFTVLVIAVVMAYLPDIFKALRVLPASSAVPDVIEGEIIANGGPISMSDATVIFDNNVAGCGVEGQIVPAGPDNRFKIACSSPPEVQFTMTIEKPGFAATHVLINPRGTNQFTLTAVGGSK